MLANLPNKVENVIASLKIASFSRPTSSEMAPTNTQEYLVAGFRSWSVIRDFTMDGLYKLICGGLLS